MNEKVVAELAGLLLSTAEEVNQALEKGSISDVINNFTSQVKIMSSPDFETFQKNLKVQALTELDKTNLPQPVYEYVKASTLEKLERDLAKEYGVQVKPVRQLIEDVITTKTKTNPDDETARLKQQIVDLEKTWSEKLNAEKTNFETRFVDNELERIISELPIDAEGEKLNNQREIVRTMVKGKLQFQMENGNIVPIKDGRPVVDNKLDPVPMKDVIYGFAKDYVNLSPVKGGRGDSSSQSGSRSINFAEFCEKNGIMPNSMELVTKRAELESKGYKLE